MDFVNYSVEQMQELRQKNTSLETKLSALENHLHDAKYDMEKQTLEYQTELKLVQNAVSTARFLLYTWVMGYTAKNVIDLVQFVDFTGPMQVANKMYQAC